MGAFQWSFWFFDNTTSVESLKPHRPERNGASPLLAAIITVKSRHSYVAIGGQLVFFKFLSIPR